MRKVALLILPLIFFVFINCSQDSNTDTPVTGIVDKAGMAYSENDLARDGSLAVSADHNGVVFLEDPDNDSLPLQAPDLGESPGSDILPLILDHDARYKICVTLQGDIGDDITVAIRDLGGAIDFSMENEGCRDLTLNQGRYTMEIAKKANSLIGVETPFFITVDGDVINVYHNQCSYCDLEGVDLSGKKLVNTDFTGSRLNGADFNDTTLEFVKFTGAELTGATFANAHGLNLPTTPLDNALSSETRGHTMYVNHLPVKAEILEYVAYHTYPVVLGHQAGDRYAWGSLGGDTGGSELEDTRIECKDNEGCIDLETVSYIMSQEPCAWPGSFPRFYATVGVCWNLTNRGLYYTGKTVHKIPQYFLVETYFGTYGLDDNSTCFSSICREGRNRYGWNKCKQAVEAFHPWLGGQTNGSRVQTALSQNGWEKNPSIPRDDVDPRITIYDEFFAESSEKQNASPENQEEQISAEPDEDRQLAYLQRLLELNIRENIGAISQDQLRRMLDAHYEMYYALKSIEANSGEEYIAYFNELANNTLNRYKEILGMENYLKLMNQTKDSPFDLGNHVIK